METPSESTSSAISVDNKDNKKEESTVDSLSKSIYLIQLGDANYDESLKLAEQYKTEGNKFLQENSFALAIAKYTQAIELKIETPKNAIYYSNRAFVNTKIENYGSAIEDANEAIKCDPTYLKAYFRRSSANLCLFKYDEALKDLMFLLQKLPGDAALKDKIDRTKKLKKNSLFWECFSSEGRSGSRLSLKALYDKYTVEPSYSGSKLPEDFKYDLEWIKKLIENLKNKQYLHKKYLLYLMIKAKEIFEKQPSLIDVNFTDREITVCGDIHGQFMIWLIYLKRMVIPVKTILIFSMGISLIEEHTVLNVSLYFYASKFYIRITSSLREVTMRQRDLIRYMDLKKKSVINTMKKYTTDSVSYLTLFL